MDEMTQPQVVQTANQPGPPESGAFGGANTETVGGAQTRAAEATGTARSEAGDKPFMTVRYNKQDKPLSREEAAVYAQKGMNYDKLSDRLKAADEQLKTLSGIKALAAEYAEENGVSKTEAMGAIQTKLKGQDMQAVVNAQLDAFVEAHPDIDPGKLPEAVLTAWKRGVPLGEAYYAHQASMLGVKAREIERVERAKAANASNTAASMGIAGSMGAAHQQPLTDEAIQSMSPKELDREHTRIWAYLTGKKG